jgi:hypothetical protein
MTIESACDGEVDWSGDNPGMYLKESADGPFVTLISFFRVALSPHGRGTALLMLQSPQAEAATLGLIRIVYRDRVPEIKGHGFNHNRWMIAQCAAAANLLANMAGT